MSSNIIKQETVPKVSKFKKQQENHRPGTMASLPRRQLITSETTEVSPPMMQTTTFSVSYLRVLWRIVILLFTWISFFVGNLWDGLRNKGSERQRAIRLRRILERSGGSFKKIGRLLAMRIALDLLCRTIEDR
jgi:hypothetical protein